MKSVIYTILIGVVVVFFATLFYVPNEEVFEVIEKYEVVKITKEEIVEVEPVVEQTPGVADLLAQKEKVEVIAEIPDVVQTEKEEVIEEQVEIVQTKEVPQVSFSDINKVTRGALVNIFCTTKSGGSFKPITGSGVIIDERGIILTNAHVAQYFLLKDYLTEGFITCVIRTGSPAAPLYTAEPVFISPSWVRANANNIIQQSPKGTGEDDYALLLITGRTDTNKTIPNEFSFLEPLYNSGNIDLADQVLLAGYPAGFLDGIAITKDLYISSAITEVMELFTFKDGTLDLFSIGGTVVAQQGSSGGAVVNNKNELIGIIVTSTVAESTEERDLKALTIAHINRSFVRDTGFDLQTLFSGNIKAEANAFNENMAPTLTQLLVDELEK